MQRCIDVFARMEWLGYAITEPLILWSLPALMLLLSAYAYQFQRSVIGALTWGAVATVPLITMVGVVGWTIRGIGLGLRKLSVRWGEDQAIKIRDPGDPG